MDLLSSSSMVSFSNAPGSPAQANDLVEAFDTLTHQAQSELGNITQSLFFIGDGLQRALADGFFNLFLPQTWAPNTLFQSGSNAVRQTIQLLQLLQPEQARLAWQELQNKLLVFILVKNLSSILHLPADRLTPLQELVEKAYSMPVFESLWAVEGLGHYYADIYWRLKGVPQGLLFEENAPVPENSLTMLNAGIGLCFADRMLGSLTSEASDQQVRSVVEYVLALCRNNCRKGYTGAAVENFGLVTRDFYPDLLQRIDQQLRQVAPEFLGYFWHGVGRGMYFSRQYFLPVLYSVWKGVDSDVYNAPDRLNAMSGLAWGATMVNLRQPAIIEIALRSYIENSDLAAGFTNGVVSSLIMRTDISPGTPLVKQFYEHRPNGGDRRLAEAWQRLIAEPSQVAIETYYPVLRQQNALSEIFRYQDLAALVSFLQQRTGAARKNPDGATPMSGAWR
jgi:hypothetical protein